MLDIAFNGALPSRVGSQKTGSESNVFRRDSLDSTSLFY